MTEHDELKRFADGDGSGPELSAAIAVARNEGPSAEQRARLRAKLGLRADAPAGNNVAAKGLLGLSAAILVVAGAALWTWLSREPAPPSPSDAPVPRVEQGPALEPPAAPPALAPEPAPRVEPEPPAARSRLRREASKPVAVDPLPAIDPAEELALLRRARSHVRSAPARALALVAEHEQRFPSGALVEEREVIAIEALLLSGDRAAGHARAAAFAARYPQSAHLRRVRVLLNDGALDQGTHRLVTPTE